MPSKLVTFFSNAGYATWFQSLIVILSVGVAAYAIRETSANVAISNSVTLAQKYFTDKPTLASASLRLRISQFQQVQEAKKTITNYDPQRDRNFDRLFEAARPLVRKQIVDNLSLQDDYNALNDFFSSVFICVSNGVCEGITSVKLLASEVYGFYNAACPFMEETALKYKNDEDSPRYIAFLVRVAGYGTDRKNYFCRDELTHYASKTN
jgi:hypothetical protein